MRWPFVEPDDFADADFFCPIGGAGRAEVHEVDAGDHQDQDGDKGKDIDVIDIAVCLQLVGFIGMEMDVVERHRVIDKMTAALGHVTRRCGAYSAIPD